MCHLFDEQQLSQFIYLAIARENEQDIVKYWQQLQQIDAITDELLHAKWQFYFNKQYFDNIIEEGQQFHDFSLIYPQACILYLESYLALNKPELALKYYYEQSPNSQLQWNLLLSKINRAIEQQQRQYTYQLSFFDELNSEEQMMLLENILRSNSDFYTNQVREIVSNATQPITITWGLLYLQQAQDINELVYHRGNITYIIKPNELPELENSPIYFMNQQILNYIDKHYPHLRDVADFVTTMLFNHYYPKYPEQYHIKQWVNVIVDYYDYIILGKELNMSNSLNKVIFTNLSLVI